MEIQKFQQQNKKIVVVGTIFVDIKGYPEGVFIPQGRNAGRIEYKYGGVGRNIADDLAGLGLHPVFVSMSDPSGPGAAIIQNLKRRGVVTDYMIEVQNGIGTWMVILTPEGDVCANLSKRQDLLPLCSVIEKNGNAIFSDADGILLEMDVEEEIVSRVFEYAERFQLDVYGVISNMTIAKERIPYIQKTACFICNKQEFGQLLEQEIQNKDPQEILEILKAYLQKSGMKCMVVTLDKDGAVFASSAGETGICPSEKVELVDSTGAGDSFFAGVSAGLIYEMDLPEACRLGTKMAAAVIRSTENVYRQ